MHCNHPALATTLIPSVFSLRCLLSQQHSLLPLQQSRSPLHLHSPMAGFIYLMPNRPTRHRTPNSTIPNLHPHSSQSARDKTANATRKLGQSAPSHVPICTNNPLPSHTYRMRTTCIECKQLLAVCALQFVCKINLRASVCFVWAASTPARRLLVKINGDRSGGSGRTSFSGVDRYGNVYSKGCGSRDSMRSTRAEPEEAMCRGCRTCLGELTRSNEWVIGRSAQHICRRRGSIGGEGHEAHWFY